MGLFNRFQISKKSWLTRIFFSPRRSWEPQTPEYFSSEYLQRPVRIDVFLPPGHCKAGENYPVLLFNDGQDMEAVHLLHHLDRGLKQGQITPLIVVAVHAGDRMQEYGAIGRPDYQGRGSKAAEYAGFVIRELLPFLRERFRCSEPGPTWAIAGFSLGGLSALDLAWNYPAFFGKVGVFSGSLWWRAKAFQPTDPDADRIMHQIIRQGPRRPGMSFWFQAGTHDEKSDRNNNGIIDAIDDTLDLMKELNGLGYQPGRDMQYVQVAGGEHHPHTWSKVLPQFLHWAFPGQKKPEVLP